MNIVDVDYVRCTLRLTEEPRLRVVDVVFTTPPTAQTIDLLADALERFGRSYEDRIVLVLSFDTPELISASHEMVALTTTRLLGLSAEVMRKVKGCLVKPRRLSSTDIALKNLLVASLATSTRKAFEVTSSTDAQERFLQRLVERERAKRLRKERRV